MDEVIKRIFEKIPIAEEGNYIGGNVKVTLKLENCHTGFDGSSDGLRDTLNLSGAFNGEALDRVYVPVFEDLEGTIVFFPVDEKKFAELRECIGEHYCARMDFFELDGAPCAQADIYLPTAQYAQVKKEIVDSLDNSNVYVSFRIRAQRKDESSKLLISSWDVHFERDFQKKEDYKDFDE